MGGSALKLLCTRLGADYEQVKRDMPYSLIVLMNAGVERIEKMEKTSIGPILDARIVRIERALGLPAVGGFVSKDRLSFAEIEAYQLLNMGEPIFRSGEGVDEVRAAADRIVALADRIRMGRTDGHQGS